MASIADKCGGTGAENPVYHEDEHNSLTFVLLYFEAIAESINIIMFLDSCSLKCKNAFYFSGPYAVLQEDDTIVCNQLLERLTRMGLAKSNLLLDSY